MAIDAYLDNITSQHRDKPNYITWLSSGLNIIDDMYTLVKSMDDAFDIDNAIGVQLDTLGVIIGRERALTFQPLNGFNPVLTDDYYRLVLKAKIAFNMWDGTIPSIYEIWNNIFGSDTDLSLQIKDNQDMSFDAYITGYADQIQQDLIQHGYIIPKPQGVRVNYIGRSKINSQQYSAMKVTVSKIETINTSWDPNEKVPFSSYCAMKVGVIKTEIIRTEQPTDIIWGASKAINPTWESIKSSNPTWEDEKTY